MAITPPTSTQSTIVETTKEVIRRSIASAFYDRLIDPEESYFVVLGRGYPWPENTTGVLIGGETVPYPIDSTIAYNEDLRNGFFAKRVGVNDVRLMLSLVEWRFGGKYAKYTSNTNIFNEEYPVYVVTDENKVYKCIRNGTNASDSSSGSSPAPSTEKPVGTGTEIMNFTDGYSWKYMFTVPDFEKRLITQFTEETNYIPVSRPNGNYAYNERILQFQVQENAVPGTVDTVFLNPVAALTGAAATSSVSSARDTFGTGKSSTDYLTALVAPIGATSIKLGQPSIGGVLPGTSGAYSGYTILITNKSASGVYRKITGYDASTKTVYFTEPLEKTVPVLSEYQVAPTLEIYGDGTGAEGYLKLTEYPSQLNIQNYIVVNKGRDYTTASITGPFPSGTISNLQIHPNVSPIRGHGSDAVEELNPTYIQICVDINGGETASTLRLADGSFRQVALLKNPRLWKSNKIAGTENAKFHEIFIRADGTGASKLAVGQYIFGEESRAVGEITNTRYDSQDAILLIKNLNGTLLESVPGVSGERVSLYSHANPNAQFSLVSSNIGYVVSSTPYLASNSTNQVYKLTTTVGITGANIANTSAYAGGHADLSSVAGNVFSSRIFSIRPSTSPDSKYFVELNGVVGSSKITDPSTIGQTLLITSLGGITGSHQIVSVDPPDFEPFTGEVIYIENTEEKTRDRVQTERVSILIKI